MEFPKKEQTETMQPHVFNPAAFGKAANNAWDLLLTDTDIPQDDFYMPELKQKQWDWYEKMTIAIYKKDVEIIEKLKQEMNKK